MCDFVSFLIHKDKKGPKSGKLYFTDLFSHSMATIVHDLGVGDYREVEWTGEEEGYLKVRCHPTSDENWYRALILAEYPTRSALLANVPPIIKGRNATYYYEHNTGIHRIVRKDGSKYWYLNGEVHREDGPAVECADGYKAWYLNGKYREDGPAIEYADGSRYWWLNGDFIYAKSEAAVENGSMYNAPEKGSTN
jgi:hypothetical protein